MRLGCGVRKCFMRKAMIIGVAGQDGYYLTHLLASKGYAVYGVDRFISLLCSNQKEVLSGVHKIELANSQLLVEYVKEIIPDEIYYLAAHHFSSQGKENRTGLMSPFLSVNLITPNEVLEYLTLHLRKCKFFYAASSHIFGHPDISPQTELTPTKPSTPYSITKNAGLDLCRYYRETHGIYTVVGILYNHESQRRGMSFITAQIARAAALAYCGSPSKLVVRSLDSIVDWGAAEDYVRAMWLSMQHPFGDEYIIASGIPRTVRDFANVAFECVGLNANDFITQNETTIPEKAPIYIGDSSKIKTKCGWSHSISFRKLVCDMVKKQIKDLQKKDNGK
jgi:GDPmannose 4,6-dehydratase